MALDSRQKRMSVLNMAAGCDGATLHALFQADGSVDADDKLHLLDLYSGIAASALVVIIGAAQLSGVRDIDGALRGIRDIDSTLKGEVD